MPPTYRTVTPTGIPIPYAPDKPDQHTILKRAENVERHGKGPRKLVWAAKVGRPAGILVQRLHTGQLLRSKFTVLYHRALSASRPEILSSVMPV